MSNTQGGPGNSLGLAVGATNLACTGDGQRTLVQPAAVTLRPGLTLTGFVDRVGDPVPIIAADGTAHRSEMLLAEALDRLARGAAIAPVSEVAVAVPAHWRPQTIDALREALGRKAGLAKSPLVTDATAALTALHSNPGLPSTGVIVLCDFGGSGSSITLVDAAADAPIGDTVRVRDFSGDQIDQAVLSRVVSEILDASHADPAGTAMVGSLARLRDECRRAKERLSDETATGIAVDVPGLQTTVRMTRMELDGLIAEPLSEFMAALGDTLDRNRVPLASVSAVATVGGGARIPLITQRLSEYLRVGVVTTPRPQLTVADGVALIAHRGQIVETATAMASAAPATATVAAAAFAGAASPAVGALAWSEVDDDDMMAAASPLEHDYPGSPVESRPELHFEHDEWDQQAPSRRRSPVLLFGLATVAVAVAAVVFGLTAFTRDTPTVPAGSTAGITSAAPAPAADSAPAVQQAQAPAQPPAPAAAPVQAPAVTTVAARPAPQAVEQQPAAPAPASAPAPEAPAPAAPAPEAPAPEAPTPAPPPANPAPAAPWTPPWTPPWKLPTHNGTGTPPADSGTGTSTGGTGTGSNSSTGTGSSTGTQTGADTGAGTGAGSSAKDPAAPGLIPILQPGN